MSQIIEQTQAQPVNQESEMERKIKRFIEAAILVNPSLQDRLNVAACVQYLQLPDTTYGWDATNFKTPGSMPLEYKIACLMPTVANGLPPGSIIWLGNRTYATSSAISFVANRDLKTVSGISFRPFTDIEKQMFGIGDKDMAVVASRKVLLMGQEVTYEGFGVLGWDESQPNAKGNYKVATEKTRDRMQFVRTRAIRDMYNRHISISGVPSEDEYYPTPEAEPVANIENDKQAVLPSTPWAKPDPKEIDKALELKFADLFAKVKQMGGDADAIVGDESISVTVSIKLMELWIENNKPPEPEPPKGKRSRRTKEQMEADEKAKALADESKPAVEIVVSPMNQMDESVSQEELQSIIDREPVLEYDLTDESEELDPLYEGTDEQKELIRIAVREAGLPDGNGLLHAIAGAMKGQPMSKLPVKVKSLKPTARASDLPKAQPPTSSIEEQREKLKVIADKVTKLGAKTMEILQGQNPWNLVHSGESKDVLAATAKLWAWYERHVNT